MIVSNCPRCRESIRIPALEIPEETETECPWCGESYSFAEVLRQLPPLLRIRPGDDVHGDQSLEMLAQGMGDDDQFTYEFEDPAEEPVLAPMNVAPLVTTSRRRNSGGGVRRAMGIVLGGLLALPFAGAILLLLGRAPDLGFWPFDGRRQTQPDRVNTRRSAFPDTAVASNSDLPNARPANAPTQAFELIPEPVLGKDGQDDSSEQLQDGTDFDLPSAIVRGGSPSDKTESTGTQPRESTASLDLPSDPSSQQSGGRSKLLIVPIDSISEDGEDSFESASERLSREANQRAAPADSLGTISSPEVGVLEMPNPDMVVPSLETPEIPAEATNAQPASEEPIELVEAATKASRMIDAMATFDGPEKERSRRLLMTYMRIAKLCSIAEEDSESLRSVANQLKFSPVQSELSGLAGEWLIANSRDSDGILVVGQLIAGSEPTIKLDTGEMIKVIGSVDPLPANRAIVMGRLIGKASIETTHIEALPNRQ